MSEHGICDGDELSHGSDDGDNGFFAVCDKPFVEVADGWSGADGCESCHEESLSHERSAAWGFSVEIEVAALSGMWGEAGEGEEAGAGGGGMPLEEGAGRAVEGEGAVAHGEDAVGGGQAALEAVLGEHDGGVRELDRPPVRVLDRLERHRPESARARARLRPNWRRKFSMRTVGQKDFDILIFIFL